MADINEFIKEEKITSEFEQRINTQIDRATFLKNPETIYNVLNILIVQLLAELKHQERINPNKKPPISSKEIEEKFTKLSMFKIKFEDALIDEENGYYIQDDTLGIKFPAKSSFLSESVKMYTKFEYIDINKKLYIILIDLQYSLKAYGLFDSRARSVLSPYVESLIGITHEEAQNEENEEFEDDITENDMHLRGDRFGRR
ncbi:MAG: hypothetical protein C0175_04860 [Caldisericum exile]|uniref:Uncharacterized protein n=1 Tax=Caldisericum exile TaxID=693075 RepID=A0A2J6X5G0_9BACT|nr:MAG: hypothetical protein C0175_04860 [Caldisericum exile]